MALSFVDSESCGGNNYFSKVLKKGKNLFRKVSWINSAILVKKIHGKVVATVDWQKLWWMINYNQKGVTLAKTCSKKFQGFWPKLNQSWQKKSTQNVRNWIESLSELFLRHSSWLMRRLAGKCRPTCCKSSKAMPSSWTIRCFVF